MKINYLLFLSFLTLNGISAQTYSANFNNNQQPQYVVEINQNNMSRQPIANKNKPLNFFQDTVRITYNVFVNIFSIFTFSWLYYFAINLVFPNFTNLIVFYSKS